MVSPDLTDLPAVEAFRRRVRTEDGWEIVTMRCTRLPDGWMVGCEVRLPGASEEATIRPGPYSFLTERAARAFADEATLAFEYLGCEID